MLWDEGGAHNCTGARLLMGDHQGSVIGLATCAGAPLSVNRYDERGTRDSINAGRFQYTGQAWLPELGVYHYKARLYSPALGFLQVDLMPQHPPGTQAARDCADAASNMP